MAHYRCAKLPMQVFMCVSVYLSVALTALPSHTHTHTHTYTHTLTPPLPLGAGWLPRLQCRLSSSCCYETRTDRPELNDNVSLALARGPQEPIRDSLDQHFPIWGQGNLGLIVWAGGSLLSHTRSRVRRCINSVSLISSADVSFGVLREPEQLL